MLTVGSLFSGIGGFDLGLERAGMRTVWFCEQDPFCQRVLANHWPDVPCHSDVRALVADADGGGCHGLAVCDEPHDQRPNGAAREWIESPTRPAESGRDGNDDDVLPVPVPYVDVLCGGFPCQDISVAGRGAGLDGDRSGLWSEYARLIRELRPRYVVVENVAALLARGFGRVLGDLAACGYDAEWDCIPASAVGAPHRRDRVWLVAYPSLDGRIEGHPDGRGSAAGAGTGPEHRLGDGGGALADAHGERTHGAGARSEGWDESPYGRGYGGMGDADGASSDSHASARRSREAVGESGWWSSEPDVGRVAHGVPARVDRLRSLGNALVPQIAERIGRRIVDWEGGLT